MIRAKIDQILFEINIKLEDEDEKITYDNKKNTLWNMYWAMSTVDDATTLLILKGMNVGMKVKQK